MQMRGEGSIEVGEGVDGAIIVLGDRNPLGSGKLLLQVVSDGLLLLPSEGSSMLTCPCLVQGLGHGVILLPFYSGRGGGRPSRN
jgi:hypothetical protein